MNTNPTTYRRTATTVSFINYHFVFCPARRRKIFDIPGIEERFKELTSEICAEMDIQILAMECDHDHVHLFVSALPQISIPDIMNAIKGTTSVKLRQEFPVLTRRTGLWINSIKKLGYSKPTYKEPKDPDDKAEASIQVQVNIKKWRWVKQNVDLE